MSGCLNCITNDECLICSQGYYLFSGICIKNIEGLSICSDNDTCLYCLSGYEFNSEKKCVFINNYDFNVSEYKRFKNELIKLFYPGEIIQPDDDNGIKEFNYTKEIITVGYDTSDSVSPIIECNSNCLKCDENTGKCEECNLLYYLENNTCIKHCSDEKLYRLFFIR